MPRKKCLMLLIFILSLSGILKINAAAAGPASGTCGPNAKWTYNGGTLTISGYGKMYDDIDDDEIFVGTSQWKDMGLTVKKVVIEPGITNIGKGAFTLNNDLKEVFIASTVKSINKYAFYKCTKLQKVTMKEGLKIIDKGAFQGCASLKTINIPEGVTTIDEDAFSLCSSLQKITMKKGIKTIGFNAFVGCDSLKTISIPEGVTTIDEGAFSGCDKLKKVTMKKGVRTIGDGAFDWCSSLESVNIPEGVTRIGIGAFMWTALKKVTIPSTVKSIGECAFGDCVSLKSVTVKSKKVKYIGNDVFGARETYVEHYGLSMDDDNDVKSCRNLNIELQGYKNSTTEKYALKNSLPFRYIGRKALTKIKVNKPRTFSNKLSVSWKKYGKARKYEIMMSNDKNFMAGSHTKKVSSSQNKASVKINTKKTYYLRVRSWETLNGKVRPCRWSDVYIIKGKKVSKVS